MPIILNSQVQVMADVNIQTAGGWKVQGLTLPNEVKVQALFAFGLGQPQTSSYSKRSNDGSYHPSPQRQDCSTDNKKLPLRAGFIESENCPPITLQCRTLQSLNQQKLIKPKAPQAKPNRISSNQTKNIAKNYGKAIIAYIQKNKRLFRNICKETSTPYQRIMEELPELKTILTTVVGFRKIWTDYKYAECMRVASNVFLRKNALGYIFNSKVSNIQTHIKYRVKFLSALTNPENFDHIKDY